MKEDAIHPILSVTDMGQQSTERTVSGSGNEFLGRTLIIFRI